MIVERHVYIAKPGRIGDMLDHLRRQLANKNNPWPHDVRIYQNRIGPFDCVAVELESESLAAYEETWTRWTSVAFTEEMNLEWRELKESGGQNEIWTVEVIRGSKS